MKSKIFTEAEQYALNKRLQGSKDDKNGIYASRVKPKIKELLDVWFSKKKELSKLVIEKGSIRGGKDDE